VRSSVRCNWLLQQVAIAQELVELATEVVAHEPVEWAT
jgi:hypothetical protein